MHRRWSDAVAAGGGSCLRRVDCGAGRRPGRERAAAQKARSFAESAARGHRGVTPAEVAAKAARTRPAASADVPPARGPTIAESGRGSASDKTVGPKRLPALLREPRLMRRRPVRRRSVRGDLKERGPAAGAVSGPSSRTRCPPQAERRRTNFFCSFGRHRSARETASDDPARSLEASNAGIAGGRTFVTFRRVG